MVGPLLVGILKLEPKASHAFFKLTNSLEDTCLRCTFYLKPAHILYKKILQPDLSREFPTELARITFLFLMNSKFMERNTIISIYLFIIHSLKIC